MALDPNCGAERPKEFIAFSVIARWNVFRPQIEFHLECIAATRCDPLGRLNRFPPTASLALPESVVHHKLANSPHKLFVLSDY